MPLTVPHAAGTAALSTLATALVGANASDAVVGADLTSQLTSLVNAWNALATTFNSDDAAYPGRLSTAIAAATEAATAAESEAARLGRTYTPASGVLPSPGDVMARINAVRMAFQDDFGHIRDALDGANNGIAAVLVSKPVAPDDSGILSLVTQVNEFIAYLGAA